ATGSGTGATAAYSRLLQLDLGVVAAMARPLFHPLRRDFAGLLAHSEGCAAGTTLVLHRSAPARNREYTGLLSSSRENAMGIHPAVPAGAHSCLSPRLQ